MKMSIVIVLENLDDDEEIEGGKCGIWALTV